MTNGQFRLRIALIDTAPIKQQAKYIPWHIPLVRNRWGLDDDEMPLYHPEKDGASERRTYNASNLLSNVDTVICRSKLPCILLPT